MHTLILLAALSNQLFFDTRQQGERWLITPRVTLNQDCDCRLQLDTRRQGSSGSSTTRQSSRVQLRAGEALPLSEIVVQPQPGDNITITVTLSDNASLHLTRQWSPPDRT